MNKAGFKRLVRFTGRGTPAAKRDGTMPPRPEIDDEKRAALQLVAEAWTRADTTEKAYKRARTELAQRIEEAKAIGLSLQQIADETGRSKSRIWQIVQRGT